MTSKENNRHRWQTTWLWKTLESRCKKKSNNGASEFLPAVSDWMKKVEKVLTSGGTSPNDFTLHDADHSFRVAVRMCELMSPPIQKNISDLRTGPITPRGLLSRRWDDARTCEGPGALSISI